MRISRETSVGAGLIAAAWLTPVLTGMQSLVVAGLLAACVCLAELLSVTWLRVATTVAVAGLLGATYYSHAGQGAAQAFEATFLTTLTDPATGPLTSFAALAVSSVSITIAQMHRRRYWTAVFSAAGAPLGLALAHESNSLAFALFAIAVCAGTAVTPLDAVQRRFGGSAPSMRVRALGVAGVCCAVALALGPGAMAMRALGHEARDTVEQQLERTDAAMNVPASVAAQLTSDLAAGQITPTAAADALGNNGIEAQLQALSQMDDPRLLQQVLDQASAESSNAAIAAAGAADGLQVLPDMARTAPQDRAGPRGGQDLEAASSGDAAGLPSELSGGSIDGSPDGAQPGSAAAEEGNSAGPDGGSANSMPNSGNVTAEPALQPTVAAATGDDAVAAINSDSATTPTTALGTPPPAPAASGGAQTTLALVLTIVGLVSLVVLAVAALGKRRRTPPQALPGVLFGHPVVVAWQKTDSAIAPLVGPSQAARTFAERHLELRLAAPELSASHDELAQLADAAVFEGPLPADAAQRADALACEIRGRVHNPARQRRARSGADSAKHGDTP